MDAWSSFYSVTAAAAATLMGLLFVAVSLNTAEVFGAEKGRQKSLAEQSFRNYIAVFVFSIGALFPKVDLREFNLLAIVVAAVSGVIASAHVLDILRAWRNETSHLNALRRHVISLLAFGAMAYAAVKSPAAPGDARILFAGSTIVLIVAATIISWELLQAIAMVKRSPPNGT